MRLSASALNSRKILGVLRMADAIGLMIVDEINAAKKDNNATRPDENDINERNKSAIEPSFVNDKLSIDGIKTKHAGSHVLCITLIKLLSLSEAKNGVPTVMADMSLFLKLTLRLHRSTMLPPWLCANSTILLFEAIS